jgi:NAD(P)-dependent dehydrogenase (short-subunit alcohol dehydrogenase family)
VKRVLVTGASAGIGRATALAFAAEGATVYATARSRERLDALVSSSSGPGRIVPIVADVTDLPGMDAMAERVLADGGPPDVVVANAGIGLDALFQSTTDENLRIVLDVNVLGVYRTVRPFIEPMVRRGSGRILFISSVVGKRGTPHYSAYSASKFALRGMADSLRAELYGTGVTVGVIYPSSTTTEFRERMLHAGVSQKSFRIKRHSAEAVARAILRMSRWTRREMVLSLEGKLMGVVNTLAPWLVDWVLAKALRPKSS